jgi:hypothetical protein
LALQAQAGTATVRSVPEQDSEQLNARRSTSADRPSV